MSNDPRGSGSTETRKPELRDLGEVHTGRRTRHEQPSKQALRSFYRGAEPLLQFDPLGYREREREIIAQGIRTALVKRGYTVWACALCANRAHVVARAHRDRAEAIWHNLARATADAIRAAGVVPADHPVWSHRPYKVFLYTWQHVVDRVGYVEDTRVRRDSGSKGGTS